MRGFALANQCAFSHQRTTNSTGDRGCYAGIAKVDVCICNGGLACDDLSERCLFVGDGGVVLLLADGIGLNQGLVATSSGRGLSQIGFCLCQCCLGALQVGFVGRVVDLEKWLAGFYVRAFLEQTLLHDPCCTGANLCNTRGFEAAGEVRNQRHALQRYRNHAHFGWLRLRCSLCFLRIFFFVTAGGKAQSCNQAQAYGHGACAGGGKIGLIVESLVFFIHRVHERPSG